MDINSWVSRWASGGSLRLLAVIITWPGSLSETIAPGRRLLDLNVRLAFSKCSKWIKLTDIPDTQLFVVILSWLIYLLFDLYFNKIIQNLNTERNVFPDELFTFHRRCNEWKTMMLKQKLQKYIFLVSHIPLCHKR